MRINELVQSFAGMILLLIGKSGVGKSTFIKHLILKDFKKSFNVLDGIKSTTTVLMHYLFKKDIDKVTVGIKFKSKEKLRILFAENLFSGLERLMGQYVSGLPKNMSPYEESEWIKKQLNDIATKDYTKFFNIDKLIADDKDVFVKMIHDKIYMEMQYLYQEKRSLDKVKDKQEDLRLQIASAFSTSSVIQSNFNDIFEWLYEKATSNIINSGFAFKNDNDDNDEDVYFEGKFLNGSSLQKALLSINNSNRNYKSQDDVSSISMVEEIFLELPMCNNDWPDHFVITDSYGLTHDGSKNINENLEAILIGQRYNGIILFKEYADDDGIEKIVKNLLDSAHSCHVIPVINKIDEIFSSYSSDDEDDEDELNNDLITQLLNRYIPQEENSFNQLIKELVKDQIRFKVGSVISSTSKKTNFNLPERFLMDFTAKEIIKQGYSAYKRAQVSIKLKAKTPEIQNMKFYDQYLIFEESLSIFTPQIIADLKIGVVKQYQEYVANSDDYHGNTVNTLVAQWMNGYGHNSNAQVYCNIYSNPFRSIQNTVIKAIKHSKSITLNDQVVDCLDESSKKDLIEACWVSFKLHLYNGLVKKLAYDNLGVNSSKKSLNLRNIWWYSKHHKLSVLLKLLEEVCSEPELVKVIKEALSNASHTTISNANLTWE
ncbi:hypothetical protein [Desulfuribacillus stibiiarsenatis]|nr:hypothetical protein [Desulfuribacillus stibiiarsenatis]